MPCAHLETYESQWEGWHPIYEMENKTCSKPPTRLFNINGLDMVVIWLYITIIVCRKLFKYDHNSTRPAVFTLSICATVERTSFPCANTSLLAKHVLVEAAGEPCLTFTVVLPWIKVCLIMLLHNMFMYSIACIRTNIVLYIYYTYHNTYIVYTYLWWICIGGYHIQPAQSNSEVHMPLGLMTIPRKK